MHLFLGVEARIQLQDLRESTVEDTIISLSEKLPASYIDQLQRQYGHMTDDVVAAVAEALVRPDAGAALDATELAALVHDARDPSLVASNPVTVIANVLLLRRAEVAVAAAAVIAVPGDVAADALSELVRAMTEWHARRGSGAGASAGVWHRVEELLTAGGDATAVLSEVLSVVPQAERDGAAMLFGAAAGDPDSLPLALYGFVRRDPLMHHHVLRHTRREDVAPLAAPHRMWVVGCAALLRSFVGTFLRAYRIRGARRTPVLSNGMFADLLLTEADDAEFLRCVWDVVCEGGDHSVPLPALVPVARKQIAGCARPPPPPPLADALVESVGDKYNTSAAMFRRLRDANDVVADASVTVVLNRLAEAYRAMHAMFADKKKKRPRYMILVIRKTFLYHGETLDLVLDDHADHSNARNALINETIARAKSDEAVAKQKAATEGGVFQSVFVARP